MGSERGSKEGSNETSHERCGLDSTDLQTSALERSYQLIASVAKTVRAVGEDRAPAFGEPADASRAIGERGVGIDYVGSPVFA